VPTSNSDETDGNKEDVADCRPTEGSVHDDALPTDVGQSSVVGHGIES